MKIQIPVWLTTYGTIFIIIVGSFWFAAQFVEPAPPKSITMAAGRSGGAYYHFAQEYKRALKDYDVDVEVIETAGSVENMALLQSGEADFAFMQSGIAQYVAGKERRGEVNRTYDERVAEERFGGVEALSSLYFEPLWIFVRKGEAVPRLLDFQGKRIAADGAQSGTYAVARQLFEANGMSEDTLVYSDVAGRQGEQALIDGSIDALFMVSGLSSETLIAMLENPALELMSLRRSLAYDRHFTFLRALSLPEGGLSLEKNIPPQEIDLVAPVAMMVSSSTAHSALKSLVIQVGAEIFDETGPYREVFEFPASSNIDLPLAGEAKRYFKYGPGILERYLPFWVANLLERLAVMLIPLLAIMMPLLKIAPPTYRWRIRSKIYKWYRDLRKWEQPQDNHEDIDKAQEALRVMDRDVLATNVPLAYRDEVYDLRLHIGFVREKLKRQQARIAKKNAETADKTA